MNLPLYYYPHMEMKYIVLLDEKKKNAATAKERLMAINPDLINQLPVSNEFNDPKYRIANEVRLYFKDALFFHDEETLEKIKSFTNRFKSDNILRWFISLSDINQQYQNIRENNIKIDSLLAYGFIEAHLASKFLYEMLMIYAPAIRDDIRMSKLTKDLINLKKRREYSGSDPKSYNDFYEWLINELINEFIKIPDRDSEIDLEYNINTFVDFSKGKTESTFLKILLEECFSYNEKEINKTKFLASVFDLFRLIMPDRNLMDEKTFFETPDLSYKNYDSYKAHVLRKIIYPKRTTKKVSSDLGSQ